MVTVAAVWPGVDGSLQAPRPARADMGRPAASSTATEGFDATPTDEATRVPGSSATSSPPPTSTQALDGTPTGTPTFTGPPNPTGAATDTPTAVVDATPTTAATFEATAQTITPDAPGPVDDTRLWLPFVQQPHRVGRWASRVWGMQLALEDLSEVQPGADAIELKRARESGLAGIRTNVRWDWIEPRNVTPTDYDWSLYDERLGGYADAGYDVLVVLVAYPSWAARYQCGYELLPGMEAEWREFVGAVAERYGTPRFRVVGWEIGNEVDGKTVVTAADHERSADWGGGQPTTPYGGCWGDRPAAYRRFLHAAREEIRARTPDALVSLGGLANADLYDMFHMDFLDGFLDAGGGDDIDFLSYHWFPDVPHQVTGPEKLRRLRQSLARHGCDRPIWLTETYRLTWPADPHGEASQIRFLSRELVEVLADPAVERVYWYGWLDYPDSLRRDPNEAHRGIVRSDHSPKAALSMLPWVITHTNGRAVDISTRAVQAWRFSLPGQPVSVIAWSRTASQEPLRIPAATGTTADVTYFPEPMLLEGRCCAHVEVPEEGGEVTLWVGSDTLFVRLRGP